MCLALAKDCMWLDTVVSFPDIRLNNLFSLRHFFCQWFWPCGFLLKSFYVNHGKNEAFLAQLNVKLCANIKFEEFGSLRRLPYRAIIWHTFNVAFVFHVKSHLQVPMFSHLSDSVWERKKFWHSLFLSFAFYLWFHQTLILYLTIHGPWANTFLMLIPFSLMFSDKSIIFGHALSQWTRLPHQHRCATFSFSVTYPNMKGVSSCFKTAVLWCHIESVGPIHASAVHRQERGPFFFFK